MKMHGSKHPRLLATSLLLLLLADVLGMVTMDVGSGISVVVLFVRIVTAVAFVYALSLLWRDGRTPRARLQ